MNKRQWKLHSFVTFHGRRNDPDWEKLKKRILARQKMDEEWYKRELTRQLYDEGASL